MAYLIAIIIISTILGATVFAAIIFVLYKTHYNKAQKQSHFKSSVLSSMPIRKLTIQRGQVITVPNTPKNGSKRGSIWPVSMRSGVAPDATEQGSVCHRHSEKGSIRSRYSRHRTGYFEFEREAITTAKSSLKLLDRLDKDFPKVPPVSHQRSASRSGENWLPKRLHPSSGLRDGGVRYPVQDMPIPTLSPVPISRDFREFAKSIHPTHAMHPMARRKTLDLRDPQTPELPRRSTASNRPAVVPLSGEKRSEVSDLSVEKTQGINLEAPQAASVKAMTTFFFAPTPQARSPSRGDRSSRSWSHRTSLTSTSVDPVLACHTENGIISDRLPSRSAMIPPSLYFTESQSTQPPSKGMDTEH
ncbi:hypothetical protein MMC25_004281 [Agyrium rufum]|nr:hypothetical protein [Agyrium rufum]